MRIDRTHQQRVVPTVRPAHRAATRYAFIRAHHDGAALATGSGLGLLVLATSLLAA